VFRRARKKIEYIMEVADNASTEKRTFTRRLSSSSSRRGGTRNSSFLSSASL
jgi:hypothetical protein